MEIDLTSAVRPAAAGQPSAVPAGTMQLHETAMQRGPCQALLPSGRLCLALRHLQDLHSVNQQQLPLCVSCNVLKVWGRQSWRPLEHLSILHGSVIKLCGDCRSCRG